METKTPTPEDEIRRELDPDERLLWTGVPKQGPVLRRSDAFMIPFSLLWALFAVLWELGAIQDGSVLMMLFGVPFLLMAVYITLGRFWVDARVRAATVYALTDRRVLIVSGRAARTMTSYPLQSLQDVSLTERADGEGTIRFGRPHPFSQWYEGMHWPGQGVHLVPAFEMIQAAREVHTQVLEARHAAA